MQEGRAREQFAQYVDTIFGTAAPAAPAPAPAPAAGYPIIRDGGELPAEQIPDLRSTQDKFAEWFGEKKQFDPYW